MSNIVVEQIKDSYGNLIQLWGIYRVSTTIDNSNSLVKKSTKKKLLGTYDSLKEANKRLK